MKTLEECKKPFHKHLMIRGYANYAPTDTDEVIGWIDEFISFLGMKKLQGPFASYVDVIGNKGLTAVAMIETSHIAFHIWDEQNPALLQFDVYTCGSLNVEETLEKVSGYFDLCKYEYLVYDRENGFELAHSGSK